METSKQAPTASKPSQAPTPIKPPAQAQPESVKLLASIAENTFANNKLLLEILGQLQGLNMTMDKISQRPAAAPAQAQARPGVQVPAKPQAAARPAPVASDPHGTAEQFVDCKLIKVLPQPGGKCILEFWKPGRSYKEEGQTFANDKAQDLLDAAGIEHDVRMAEELAVEVRVYWVLGRERPPKDGKPASHYHDITRLEVF